MILDNACGYSALVTSQLIDVLSRPQSQVEDTQNMDEHQSAHAESEEDEDVLMRNTQIIASDLSQKVISAATMRIAELDWADHVFTLKMNQEVRSLSRLLS